MVWTENSKSVSVLKLNLTIQEHLFYISIEKTKTDFPTSSQTTEHHCPIRYTESFNAQVAELTRKETSHS